MQRIDLSSAIRRKLTDTYQRNAMMDVLNWANSDVSRFLAGTQGIPLDKVDALVEAVGFVPVESKYLLAVQTLCVVGSQCQCAIRGQGACGHNLENKQHPRT